MRKAVLVVTFFILLPVVAAEAPREDESEFYFARLIYRNNGQRGYSMGGDACGGGGWRTDTPDADQKYAWGIQRLTGLRVHYDPRNPVHAVGIMDPEYPPRERDSWGHSARAIPLAAECPMRTFGRRRACPCASRLLRMHHRPSDNRAAHCSGKSILRNKTRTHPHEELLRRQPARG